MLFYYSAQKRQIAVYDLYIVYVGTKKHSYCTFKKNQKNACIY